MLTACLYTYMLYPQDDYLHGATEGDEAPEPQDTFGGHAVRLMHKSGYAMRADLFWHSTTAPIIFHDDGTITIVAPEDQVRARFPPLHLNNPDSRAAICAGQHVLRLGLQRRPPRAGGRPGRRLEPARGRGRAGAP